MMRVRTLVGRMAGQVIEMPETVAQSCLAMGTAVLPDQDVKNVRGMKIKGEDIGTDRMVRPANVTKRAKRRQKAKALQQNTNTKARKGKT